MFSFTYTISLRHALPRFQATPASCLPSPVVQGPTSLGRKGREHQAHNVLSAVYWEFSGCFPSAPEQLSSITIPELPAPAAQVGQEQTNSAMLSTFMFQKLFFFQKK